MRLKAIFISALGSILVMAPLLAAAATEACLMCHTKQNAGLVLEWKQSKHAKNGLGCLICHEGKEGDPASWKHKGAWVSAIVTPKTCGKCHEAETDEFSRSHHAKAGEILASLDNVLAEKVAGLPDNNADAVNGCWQCHGTIVKFKKNPDGSPMRVGPEQKPVIDPTTWPNSGIGRLNHDGSKGSCNACHSRHAFEAKLARNPKNCGKCHMGPDHPQIEIYNESKHGILYRANVDKMNLNSKNWVVGVDYTAAPTCATCHMGATKDQKGTHDVGERISWTLRPAISTKLNMIRLANGDEFDQPAGAALPKVGDAVKGSTVTEILTWEQRRNKMKNVCSTCHTGNTIDGHYKQFDDVVDLYNDKYAKPIAAIMKELEDKGYLTHQPMDAKIKWTWFEIWHHEGRRARHGASMNGPDYTWWHGIYEVSQHTYFKWIPELKEVVKAKDGNEKFAEDMLAKYFKPIAGHDWFFNGMGKDQIEKVRKGYEERYGKGSMK